MICCASVVSAAATGVAGTNAMRTTPARRAGMNARAPRDGECNVVPSYQRVALGRDGDVTEPATRKEGQWEDVDHRRTRRSATDTPDSPGGGSAAARELLRLVPRTDLGVVGAGNDT